MTVDGGIVSYNPDIALLLENVRAAAPQVRTLRVFDNGSENLNHWALAVERAAPNVEVLPSKDNHGLAVALDCLAEAAWDSGADAVLLLDQDSVADPGLVTASQSVAEALARKGRSWGVIGATYRDRNLQAAVFGSLGEEAFVDRARVITSGSLVSLEAWRAVGGYDEAFFIEGVDNDFCDSLTLAGYAVVQSTASGLLHQVGEKRPGLTFAGRTLYRYNYAPYRWEDRFRSKARVIRKRAGTPIARREARSVLWWLGRSLLAERNRGQVLGAAIRGLSTPDWVPECNRPNRADTDNAI